MTPVFSIHRGTLPLLVSVPHAGTEVPRELLRRFTLAAQALPDTDWHVDKLYAFVRDMGASMIVANYSRYVVDLNRSPDSKPLYASNPTSPVCPTRTFADEPIYMNGQEPDAEEIQHRIEAYWRPYHDELERELARLRAEHRAVLLWDAHSVASEVPGLFAGVLPEFNFGTRDDAACPRSFAERLLDRITGDGKYGGVLNGRFKGGYITLNYGRPDERCYAVQLELAQRVYLDERAPATWDPERSGAASDVIRDLLDTALKAIGTVTEQGR